MWVLYTIVALIGLYYTIINKRSNKYVNWFLIISIVFLSAAPREGYDTESFIRIFDTYAPNKENLSLSYNQALIPYIALARLFYNLGIHDVFTFKFVSILLLTIVLYERSKRINLNFAMWSFFYVISTFSIDAIQHRNSIALLLFLIAMTYLFENGIKADIYFSLILLLACFVHITFAIYYVFLFAKHVYSKIGVIIRYAWGVVLVFAIASFFYRPFLKFISGLSTLFLSEYYSHFFATQVSMGVLLEAAVYLPITYMMFEIRKRYQEVIWSTEDIYQQKNMFNIVFNGFLIVFPTLLFCFFTLSASRFMRNLIPLCLFVMCNFIQNEGNHYVRRKYKLALFVLCIYTFVFINYITGPASDIVEAMWIGKPFFIQ